MQALNGVAKSLSDRLYNGKSHVILLTPRGTIAANSEGLGAGQHLSKLDGVLADFEPRLQPGRRQVTTSADRSHYVATTPVRINPGLADWTLLVAVDKALVLSDIQALQQSAADAQARQAWLAVLVGVATLGFSSMLIWLFAKRIATPIRNTATFMLQVADGDFTRRLPTVQRGDETTELATACNRFLDQTQDALRQVKDTSESLNRNATTGAELAEGALTGFSQQHQMVYDAAGSANSMRETAQLVASNAASAS